ncbi:MAG: molybdopterin-dependent oxidoreductase [Planctomycetales bacterium]|nr:molybdopterin-dependent oxidoreductase [Planctomycetales bacterium]
MKHTQATTCPLDCPDACKLLVTIEARQVVRIGGSDDDAYTDGYICGKVRNYAKHVYSENRLIQPLKRSGPKGSGQFDLISWDQAYSLIGDRIRRDLERHGGESILPLCYGGSNGKLTQDAVDARFFYRLGASRLDRTVCAAPSGAAYSAVYGKMPGVSYQDYARSKLIVVWGFNPHASGIHMISPIQQALQQGSKLVVVDPRQTLLAKSADLHLPIYPGTDLVVALGMIRWLRENGWVDWAFLNQFTNGSEPLFDAAECWTLDRVAKEARIPQASLQTFYRWYAETNPAVIRCGWGPERNRNGGSAIAAILAIPAVVNKFQRAGGFTLSNSGVWRLDNSSLVQATPPKTRRINMNLVGETLLNVKDPPVTTLFVYNCNPVATLPEQNKVLQGLRRDDLFTVVFDQVLTDTAAYADLILPATTFFEHDDLRNGYGNRRLGTVNRLIAPIGQAKPNYEVFGELIQRLGLAQQDDIIDPATWTQSLVGADSYQRLLEQGELKPASGPCPIQMQDVVPGTSSGKIELYPASLVTCSAVGLYCYIPDPVCSNQRYPLALISPSSPHTINSSLGYLRHQSAVAIMNPADAAARQLTTGQRVRLFNDSGETWVTLRIDAAITPGVVSLPKGLWQRHTLNGRTSNALSPDTLSDIGAGACFNDARIEVAAVPDP